MMKEFLLSFVLLLVVAGPTPTSAQCSCAGQNTPQTSFMGSETAVFTRIIEKVPTSQSSFQYYRGDADGVPKGCGIIRDTIFYIKTPASAAQCGVDFLQTNVRYILFGRVSNESVAGVRQTVLTIDLCQAQSVLETLPRLTQTFLYNQPTPICNNNGPTGSVPVPVPAAPSPVFVPSPVQPTSGRTINCSTCPNGYYDGCNTCGCSNGFPTGCSFRTCSSSGAAFCTNLIAPASTPRSNPVPAPVRPPVLAPVPTGFVWQPLPGWQPFPTPSTGSGSGTRPVPRPVANPVPTQSARAVNCASCGTKSFYDGCNTCSCFSNGQRSCTRRVCSSYGRAVCGGFAQPFPAPPQPTNPPPSPPVSSATIVNCRSCPRGYNDGCNECGCSNTGVAFCTNRYCFTRGTPRCS